MLSVRGALMQWIPMVIASILGVVFLALALVMGRVEVPKESIEALDFLGSGAFHQSLVDLISSAVSKIVMFTECVDFSSDVLEALKKARSRNVAVEVFASAAEIGFDATLYSLNKSADMVDGVLSNFLLVDEKALLFGTDCLAVRETIGVVIRNAPAVFADVRTFAEFTKEYSKVGATKLKPGRWENRLLVRYNTVFPHPIDGGLSFAQLFATCVAARDRIWDVIPGILSKKKQILVSSNSFVPYNNKQFKTELYNALATDEGSVSILVSNTTSESDFNATLKWVSTLHAMKRVDVRVTDQDLPTFILADRDAILFSHELCASAFGSPSELVMIVKEFRLLQNFSDVFTAAWQASTSLDYYSDRLYV